MNQASYVFLIFSPLLVFLGVCLLLWLCCKEKGYMERLLEYIAMNAFPEILKRKTTESGEVATYFNKEKMMLKSDLKVNHKVKYGLFLAAYILVVDILQLFGAFLFLKTSSYCDETKDCFLVGGPINHPVNCEDLKMKNETAVVCYEIVFRLPEAAGLCYGIFKTCTVALTVPNTLMMTVKGLDPCFGMCTMTLISCAKYLIALSCVVCVLLTMILYDGPLHGLDWEEVSAEFTVILTCIMTAIYVCVMPWEELVADLKQDNDGTPPTQLLSEMEEGISNLPLFTTKYHSADT